MKFFISCMLVVELASLGIVNGSGLPLLSMSMLGIGLLVILGGKSLSVMLESPYEFKDFPIVGGTLAAIGFCCLPVFSGMNQSLAGALLFLAALVFAFLIATTMVLTNWGAEHSFLRRFGIMFYMIGGIVASINCFAQGMSLASTFVILGMAALAAFATDAREDSSRTRDTRFLDVRTPTTMQPHHFDPDASEYLRHDVRV